MTFSKKNQTKNKSRKNHVTDILLSVSNKQDDLHLAGLISFKEYRPTKIECALIGQQSGHVSLHPVAFEQQQITKEGSAAERYKWTATVHPLQLTKKMLIEDRHSDHLSVHLIIHVEESDAPLVCAVSFPKQISKDFFKDASAVYGRQTALFSTAVSAEGFLEIRTVFFDKNTYKQATALKLPTFVSSKKDPTPVWIFGNEPFQLGQNSWAVFLSALTEYPDKDIYYLLDASSLSYKIAAKKIGDRLLSFGSANYFEKIQLAELIVSEGPAFHLFPSASSFWENRISAKRVVLPPYPLGMTSEPYTLNQSSVPWKLDEVIVSSKQEKRFVQDTLGFSDDHVHIADLPSLQLLSEQKGEDENLVLIVPNLRHPKWHSKQDELPPPLLELCQDPAFMLWITGNKLQLMVLLTEECPELKEQFASLNIKTTTADLFEHSFWMSKASIMITDDHPIAFPFSLLERPVFFYQPSSYKVFASTGQTASEQKYQNELPGETVEQPAQLIHLLNQLKNESFSMSRKNRKKARALIEAASDEKFSQTLNVLNSLT